MPLSKEDTLFLQRLLKAQGLYDGRLDGRWGPKTEGAFMENEARSNQLAAQLGTFDSRSEQNIRTLHLKAQEAARIFLKAFANAEYIVRIISGNRTYAEQDRIYAQGRTRPGKIVTDAKGGQSNHNFAIAWDIGIFEGGQYLEKGPRYVEAATIGLAVTTGVEWGGHWKKPDRPHYQLVTNKEVADVRALFEKGKLYIA